jgi:hypothetical protein
MRYDDQKPALVTVLSRLGWLAIFGAFGLALVRRAGDSAGMVRFPLRRATAEGSDPANGVPEDFMVQRSEESRRQWSLAR